MRVVSFYYVDRALRLVQQEQRRRDMATLIFGLFGRDELKLVGLIVLTTLVVGFLFLTAHLPG